MLRKLLTQGFEKDFKTKKYQDQIKKELLKIKTKHTNSQLIKDYKWEVGSNRKVLGNIQRQVITIWTGGQDFIQYICTLLHEIGHAYMHQTTQYMDIIEQSGLDPNAKIGNQTEEREAELFAHLVINTLSNHSKTAHISDGFLNKVKEHTLKAMTRINMSNKYETKYAKNRELKKVVGFKRPRTENVRAIAVSHAVSDFIQFLEINEDSK